MKKLFILLFVLVSFTSINAQTFEFNKAELDNSVITLIDKHFPTNEITVCFVEYETNRPSGRVDEYDVILNNGTKLEFDRYWQLKSIECNRSTVPMSILPQRIQHFINKHYSGNDIREYVIDRDFRFEYEVELKNGTELTFNKHYKLVHIDYNN